MPTTIKAAAEQFNCTYEAVRQMIKRHAAELDGHIQKQGRVQLLDDYALDFLRSNRDVSRISIEAAEPSERAEELHQNLTVALMELHTVEKEYREYVQKVAPKLALVEHATAELEATTSQLQQEQEQNKQLHEQLRQLRQELQHTQENLKKESNRKLSLAERFRGRKKSSN